MGFYRTHRQHSLLSSGGVPSFIGGLVVFVSAAFNAQAETWFDPAFFKDDPSMVADLSRFEKGQKITPGVYRVDIVPRPLTSLTLRPFAIPARPPVS